MDEVDVLIVGGGAAGFFAALTAAEQNRHLRIVILEKSRKPLAKVRISGGGRCNVTHACFDPAELTSYYPRGAKELRGPFSRFQPRDTVAWFEERGVHLKTEADGRIFPVTDSSQTVIDCLLREAERLGVKLCTGCAVQAITPLDGGYKVAGQGLREVRAAKVVLAPGGGSMGAYQLAASLGHSIAPPVPSLFTFNISDQRLQGLAGISVSRCILQLRLEPGAKHGRDKRLISQGPVLITHWGLSGPAVLSLSAWGARELASAAYQADLEINWMPPHTPDSMFSLLQEHKASLPRSSAARRDPEDHLPARLWRMLATGVGIQETQTWSDLSNQAIHSLSRELTSGIFRLTGKGVFKEEFVTCGGVILKDVNFRTMESRLRPGLYFAGELLDIDGLTGGFNFQSAWTTGWLAGRSLAVSRDELEN